MAPEEIESTDGSTESIGGRNGEYSTTDSASGMVNGNGTGSPGTRTDASIPSDNETENHHDNDSSDEDEANDDDSSGDDYIVSDDNEYEDILSEGVNVTSTDRVNYLNGTLDYALSSLELDKSLVLQAQLSGMLNNENQKLLDKRQELLDKLQLLQSLFKERFTPRYDPETKTNISMVQKMNHDLKDLEKRLKVLKEGTKDKLMLPFLGGKKKDGIQNRFPIEYNQAKDKVLERPMD